MRGIKIRLEGKWNVSWFVEPGVSSLQIREKGTIINEELNLHPAEGVGISNVTHKIAPGCHEWRFKFLLDPSIPESVEGLAGSFIVYDLKAEIDRGYMSKSLFAEKHVRVVRTLGRDMTETVPLPYSNEDTWKNKLWYHIYIPTRYYIFGTSITAEFILCPLHKGVETGRMKDHSKDIVVASHEQEMPNNTLPPRVEDTTGIPDQSYHFKVTLPLEKSLNKARQSVDTEHIKIFHNLKIYVNLHNPDGHVSQLLVRNLLHIFISPNLPVGDDQTIQADATQLAQLSETNENGQQEAPPTYGRNRLDQFYDDIDPNGFLSGVNRPFILIRNPSRENLNSFLDSTTLSNTARNSILRNSPPIGRISPPLGRISPPLAESSSPSASQLQSRLAELQGQEGIDEEFAQPSPHASPRLAHRSHQAVSFRGSYHQYLHPNNAANPPNHADYFHSVIRPDGEFDMKALARIPSYNTAVRTPMGTPPASTDELPTYAIAISTPSSPAVMPVQAPPRVHTRDNSFSARHGRSGSSSGSSDSGSIRALSLNGGQPAQGIMARPDQLHKRTS